MSGSASYRSVFRVTEFRALWLAHLLSVGGDQLARVAVALLVYARTTSPALTALAYAMSFLPDLIGGPLLSGLADRWPRRRVMVAADVARAGLVAVMAVPGMPLVVLFLALFVVGVMAAPFTGARSAALAGILTGDRFTTGSMIMQTTYQLGAVAGLGGGAALVIALDPQTALLIDAVTFVASAVLILTGVRSHPPPEVAGTAAARRDGPLRSVRAGLAVVGGHRQLRTLLALACLSGFYVIPEGLAVPYSVQIGDPSAVGWLLAANPVGTVIGILILHRISPPWRVQLLGPLAVATSAVLLPTAAVPGLAVSVVLWTACGICSAHDVITSATFVTTAPPEVRGQATGLAVSALRVAQGTGVVLAGLVAQVVTPATVIGVAAACGVAAGVATARAWSRAMAGSAVLPGVGRSGTVTREPSTS